MDLGCCVSMFGNTEDPVGSRYLSVLKESVYDYVELPLAQVMELTESKFESLAWELQALGLPCRCCNNFFPAKIRLTGAEVDLPKVEAYVQAAFARAGRLGAKIVVFGSGGAKNVPEGFPHDQAFGQIVSALELIDRHAGQLGLQVVIEPLNHAESNIILNLADGKKLMDAGTYENIFQLVDYYHYVKEHDTPEALQECLKDIRHVHFADPGKRGFPTEAKAEYQEFFALLKAGGYDGNVSIEAFSEEPEEDIRNAAFMRQLL